MGHVNEIFRQIYLYVFIDFCQFSKLLKINFWNFQKSKSHKRRPKNEKWNIRSGQLMLYIYTKIKNLSPIHKWSVREWSKYPDFREFSTLGLNISRTKFFRARPPKAFFIPMTRKIGYTHFWDDLSAVQKNTPLGGRPHRIFFNPQTSLRGPPWFRKTSLQRDLNFRHIFELLNQSA